MKPDHPPRDGDEDDADPVLFSLKRLAKRWDTKERTLRLYVEKGAIETVGEEFGHPKFGRGYRVHRDVVYRIEREGIDTRARRDKPLKLKVVKRM